MKSIKQDVPTELFSDSDVAVFVIDPDHKVLFWNKACEKLTGLTSHDVLNTKNHWQPFYKEYRPCLVDIAIDGNYSALPELYEKYGKSSRSPEGITAEGWYENLGGEKRYIYFIAVPIFNSSGEIVAAIESIQDFTELKHIEVEAENLLFDLNNSMSKDESLKGFIPICAQCKNIRNKDGIWTTLEEYPGNQSDLRFSQGICPKCTHKIYPEFYDKMKLK
jgi:PAS domain S-box-containing protein